MKMTRVIDGKRFVLQGVWYSQWSAEMEAGKLRKAGWLVRVERVTGVGDGLTDGGTGLDRFRVFGSRVFGRRKRG